MWIKYDVWIKCSVIYTFSFRVSPSPPTWLYATQEVTKLTLHVNSSLKIRTMGILWWAEGAQWLNPLHQAWGNRVARYSVDSPRQNLAVDPDSAGCERPPHIPKFVCPCVWACVFLLCWSSGMLTHQLAVTEPSLKCSGSDEIRQQVSLAFAASQKGCEVMWQQIMCCLKSQSGAQGNLPQLAEDQLIMWEQVSWLCTWHH